MLGKLFLKGEAGESKLLQIHTITHDIADEGLLVHLGVREDIKELGKNKVLR